MLFIKADDEDYHGGDDDDEYEDHHYDEYEDHHHHRCVLDTADLDKNTCSRKACL